MPAPRDQPPLYLWMAGALRERIAGMKPGTELPSEADLAYEYEVGRETVRRAIQELRGAGLIERRRGMRHVVREPPARTEVRVPAGARTFARAATGQECDEHDLPAGGWVQVVRHSNGRETVYPADRVVFIWRVDP